jgi:HEAT repeat protein
MLVQLPTYTLEEAVFVLESAGSSSAERMAALESLVGLGEKAGPAVSVLQEVVERGAHPEMRWLAAEALGGVGPGAADAIPMLLERIERDESRLVQEAAAQAVARIVTGDQAQDLEAIVYLTQHESPRVRYALVQAVGKAGAAASPQVPALAGLLADPDQNVRGAAAYALQVITGKSFVDLPSAPYWEGGFAEDPGTGELLIVVAARQWWAVEGRVEDW